MTDPAPSLNLGARVAALLRNRGADAAPSAPGPAAQQSADLMARLTAAETLRVDAVMTPRADIVAVEAGATLGETLSLFAGANHSRLPVYRSTLDDPLGMVHVKDLIGMIAPEEGRVSPPDLASRKVLEATMRPMLFAPPSMRALDLLRKMQARHIHMALVVDEFGGTDGLVTLEDLVEQIVGDIEDEHDEAEGPRIRARGPRVWDVDARCPIDEFEAVVGQSVATEEEGDEIDTMGGLVFTLAGHVPERGEVVIHPSGFEFVVTEADARRVKRLIVRQTAPGSARTGDAGSETGATGA